MAKQNFRITYRVEVYIDASTHEEAENIFNEMEWPLLKARSEFIEIVRVEDENYQTADEI